MPASVAAPDRRHERDRCHHSAGRQSSPSWPALPIDPIEPVDPIDAIDQLAPDRSDRPDEPTERIDPTEPTERIDPTEPTEAIEPAEAIEPSEPIARWVGPLVQSIRWRGRLGGLRGRPRGSSAVRRRRRSAPRRRSGSVGDPEPAVDHASAVDGATLARVTILDLDVVVSHDSQQRAPFDGDARLRQPRVGRGEVAGA